jgi:hypothetical protein
MEPRPWTQPLAPILPQPDRFLHMRLRVDDAWLTETGEWRSIREQTSVGLWSILGYLRWHVLVLMARDPDGAGFHEPDAYLASRPLCAAIDSELASRGEIPSGAALVTLRAIGGAPWELPVTRSRRVPSTSR